jgi:hypothetical protein
MLKQNIQNLLYIICVMFTILQLYFVRILHDPVYHIIVISPIILSNPYVLSKCRYFFVAMIFCILTAIFLLLRCVWFIYLINTCIIMNYQLLMFFLCVAAQCRIRLFSSIRLFMIFLFSVAILFFIFTPQCICKSCNDERSVFLKSCWNIPFYCDSIENAASHMCAENKHATFDYISMHEGVVSFELPGKKGRFYRAVLIKDRICVHVRLTIYLF